MKNVEAKSVKDQINGSPRVWIEFDFDIKNYGIGPAQNIKFTTEIIRTTDLNISAQKAQKALKAGSVCDLQNVVFGGQSQKIENHFRAQDVDADGEYLVLLCGLSYECGGETCEAVSIMHIGSLAPTNTVLKGSLM